MNCFIIVLGKIGIDLYVKCKKNKIFKNIIIFNRNKNSEGAKFCKKNRFSYFNTGIAGLVKKIKKSETNVIFDATSASASVININKLKSYLKDIFYINLTPSKVGDYVTPYYSLPRFTRKFNLITCGGQSSVPLILEINKKINNKIVYVELVSSIASLSAGKATRENIDEYIINTQMAISRLTKIKNNKVIINLNPSNPPVNMMNSIFFEINNKLSAIDYTKIIKTVKLINQRMKIYIPGYNAKLFKTEKNNIFRITVRVIGQGDYLPKYAGNLDIITSSATHLAKLIYEKKNYN